MSAASVMKRKGNGEGGIPRRAYMAPTVLAAAVVTYTDFRGVDGCIIESL
jgi:hypothetical protein